MAEPIELAEAKAQCRVLHNSEDAFFSGAIADARGWVERYTGLILTRRSVQEAMPAFNARISAWPITSIDAVSYVDVDGIAASLDGAAYVGQIARRPATLLAATWPTIYAGSAVTITMTAGFESAAAIRAYNPNLMRAMLLLIAGYYADRETGGLAGDVETAAKNLCRSAKRWTL